jgi:serine/threonine-protein kinase
MTGDDASALVGAVLERRWQLARSLGEGGLGLVYAANDLSGGPPVAVKLLRREFLSEAAVIDRFFQEAAAAGKVHHPGIVGMLAASRAEDGTPYLVMELCEGEPLTAIMNRGRLPLEHALAIVEQMLSALGAAHAAGVVHRDLKPDNVFVFAGSGAPQVKILDFGLARVMDAAGGAARRTKTGMLLGTPGYMSPEQVLGSKSVDLRADLWAVGVLFYEMLTGRRAYEGQNDFMRLTAVLHAPPAPIEQAAPHYAHLAPFFARALDPAPERRFQSAEEMAGVVLACARSVQPAQTVRSPGATAPQSSWAPAPPTARSTQQTPTFGGDDTAISPGPPPSVRVPVLRPERAPQRIAIWGALLLAAATGILGFSAGWLAARFVGH